MGFLQNLKNRKKPLGQQPTQMPPFIKDAIWGGEIGGPLLRAFNCYHKFYEKIHPDVCFSPLTVDETHKLWVSPACERKEAYTHNKVYFLKFNIVPDIH